ncbi:hypothetical protein [Priestia megaterium]|uniref:hypothetical protein n=1 Tax=Priestia megaterium TaxID=1404 RepID=UPI002079F6D2|nr:hypothetical protein [Priestia megaterium]USL45174.1 hypothetical protein LIS78_27650 [Priestia megaterium]
MNSKKKKLITAAVAGVMIFGVASQLPLQAKAATEIEESELPTLSDEEIKELVQLQNELQSAGITTSDIVKGIQRELPKDSSSGEMTTMGVKSQAAKVAAKAMIKKLGRYGKVAWDRTVSSYINKLPISSTSKKLLKGYLKYEVVMKTLNVVIGFSGTITAGISNQLQKTGVPKWLSDMVARALVTLLL